MLKNILLVCLLSVSMPSSALTLLGEPLPCDVLFYKGDTIHNPDIRIKVPGYELYSVDFSEKFDRLILSIEERLIICTVS